MSSERAEFINRYSGVYENSPWVPEKAYQTAAGIEDVGRLAEIFAECVDQASPEQKLDLIRAHPDLAGRAVKRGGLAGTSAVEQASAGIEQCTKEEYERFQKLNRQYRDKFGFPFVMAVRNSNRHDILCAFESRLHNDRQTEFETALAEIHKIAHLRLLELLP